MTENVSEDELPIVFFRLTWAVCIPIFFIVGFALLYLMFLLKYKHKMYYIHNLLLFIFIFFQPSMVDTLFTSISCRYIGTKSYILQDLNYECYTKQHLIFIFTLIFPLIIIWLCVIPMLLWYILKKNSNHLGEGMFFLKYSYIYKEYK